MAHLSPDAIRALAEHGDGPKVSLIMPVHPGSHRVREDPVRLENLVRRARGELLALGLRTPRIEKLLEPAERRVHDGPFWQSSGSGLAIFLADDLARVHRLPIDVPEVVEVSELFHIKPLLPLIEAYERYHVLAPAMDRVRLLRCTRHAVETVDLPDEVRFDRIAGRVEATPRPRHRHFAPAGRTGATVGQGFGHEDRRENLLEEWFHAIDHAVCDLLAGQQAPLVFVGIEGYFPRYAAHNGYPYLADAHVVENAAPLSDEALRERAWPVAEPLLTARRQRDAARFRELCGTKKTSVDLQQVLKAARFGRVDAMFVATDDQRWGTADDDDVEVHDHPEPGDHDLLNEAAVMALLSGARVHALPTEELPNRGIVCATFRW